jgi:hypothetical protein
MQNTGSLVAALWSFFLVQALFGLLPQLSREHNAATSCQPIDPSSFQSAHRVAVDAVRKLSQP